MSDYTKVVIESDTKGRVNLAVLDDRGVGHGHRLAGPKYSTGGGSELAKATLDSRDVEALRIYANYYDEIHLSDEPTELHALSDYLRRYQTQRITMKTYGDLPHQAERDAQLRESLRGACLAMANALEAGASQTAKRRG